MLLIMFNWSLNEKLHFLNTVDEIMFLKII